MLAFPFLLKGVVHLIDHVFLYIASKLPVYVFMVPANQLIFWILVIIWENHKNLEPVWISALFKFIIDIVVFVILTLK